MSTEATSRQTRYILGGVAVLAVCAAGVGSIASQALFSDTATTTATVSSGSIDLSLGGTATTGGLAVSGMLPGDVYYSKLELSNPGVSALLVDGSGLWTQTGASTPTATYNSLTSAVQVSLGTIADGAAACDATVTYDVADAVSAAVSASTFALFSDTTIASGSSQWYCVRVALPEATDNTAAGLNADLSLVFDATQVPAA